MSGSSSAPPPEPSRDQRARWSEPAIEVSRVDVEQFMSKFLVRVVDNGDDSSHVVTLSGADWERLGAAHGTPEAFIEACFRFLLDREPKEQILGSFDVSQISTYFPEFEREIEKPG